MKNIDPLYELLSNEWKYIRNTTLKYANKVWEFVKKYAIIVALYIRDVVLKCYKAVASLSLNAKVYISMSAFLCIFLFWQFMPYNVSQPVFVMVNLFLVICSASFTCYIIFTSNRIVTNLKNDITTLEQVKKDKDQEIRTLKAEIHDLNIASRKQQSFGKNSQVLIDTVRKNRQKAKSSDARGLFLLKSLAECSDICCGVIYMKRANDNVFELSGTYALSTEIYDDDFKLKEITSDDAIFGQVITSGQLTKLSDVPVDYLTIMSGLGKTDTINVYILPIKQNNEVVAVAEVASFSKLAIADIWKDIDNVLLEE